VVAILPAVTILLTVTDESVTDEDDPLPKEGGL
jgi:hypothetical protein